MRSAYPKEKVPVAKFKNKKREKGNVLFYNNLILFNTLSVKILYVQRQ